MMKQIFLFDFQNSVETAFYDHPFVQQKPALKGRWSVKWGSLRHAHAKSTLSSTLISYILPVKVKHQGWFQAYTSLHQVQMYSTVVPYSGTFTCKWFWVQNLLVMHVRGSCSPQRHFCTEWSMHGNSVIKRRWSLTTEILKSSLNCNDQWLWLFFFNDMVDSEHWSNFLTNN